MRGSRRQLRTLLEDRVRRRGAVLAEFDDDEHAVSALTQAASRGMFDHVAAQLRQRRDIRLSSKPAGSVSPLPGNLVRSADVAGHAVDDGGDRQDQDVVLAL